MFLYNLYASENEATNTHHAEENVQRPHTAKPLQEIADEEFDPKNMAFVTSQRMFCTFLAQKHTPLGLLDPSSKKDR